MNLEEEGSLESVSFYEDEMKNSSRKEEEAIKESFHYENVHQLKSNEELIEVSFYEECYASNPRDDILNERLKRILMCFESFEVIRGILEGFVEELHSYHIREKFDDFNLETMSVLNALDKGNSSL